MTDVQTDNVDAFFEKLNQAADVVTQKLVAVAPEAAEAMLSLVQAKGAFDLGISVISIVASVFFAKLTVRSFKKLMDDFDEIAIPIILFSGLASFLGFIFGSAGVFSFYNWVAAFYPEGAIAMRALEAVGINL